MKKCEQEVERWQRKSKKGENNDNNEINVEKKRRRRYNGVRRAGGEF